MEDQDRMLVQTLKGYGFTVEESMASIAQFTPDTLIVILLQFMERMGSDSVSISALKSLKGSKFRQISKLQEELSKLYGIRVDIQSITNPNVNDTRKLVVNCLSKLSASQEDASRPSVQALTFEEKVEQERQYRRQDIVDNFIQDQWINPTLTNHVVNNQRFLRLHVKNILSKEPILEQVANPGLRQYLYNSLASHIKKIDRILVRELKGNEGWQGQEELQTKIQLIKKMRRSDDPEAFLNSFKDKFEHEGDQAEQSQWGQIQSGGRVIQKAINQLKEEDAQEVQERKAKEEENQTVFTQEIQQQKQQEETQAQQVEQKDMKASGINTIENDLQNLRKHNKEEIETLSTQLKDKEQKLNKLIQKRAKIDEELGKKTDQLQSLRETNIMVQKQLETQHMMLSQIESKTAIQELDQEIQKLERENETIQNEWFKQKLDIEGELNALRQKTQERKEKVQQFKEKIKRLEDENKQVKLEGRNNIEKKEQLQVEFQKMPKEASRQLYIRKIIDLGQNLKKQQQEYQKVRKELSQIEDQIDQTTGIINRYYTELENLFQTDPKRKEQIVGQIMQKYQEYKQLFKDTMASIRDISQRKIEAQEIEVKVDLIQAKGYKQNIERLTTDLQTIKSENQRLNKK